MRDPLQIAPCLDRPVYIVLAPILVENILAAEFPEICQENEIIADLGVQFNQVDCRQFVGTHGGQRPPQDLLGNGRLEFVFLKRDFFGLDMLDRSQISILVRPPHPIFSHIQWQQSSPSKKNSQSFTR